MGRTSAQRKALREQDNQEAGQPQPKRHCLSGLALTSHCQHWSHSAKLVASIATKHFNRLSIKLEARGGLINSIETEDMVLCFFDDLIGMWKDSWPRHSWGAFVTHLREYMPQTVQLDSREQLHTDVLDTVFRLELDALYRGVTRQPPASGRAPQPGEVIVGLVQGYEPSRTIYSGVLEFFPDVGAGRIPSGELLRRRTAFFATGDGPFALPAGRHGAFLLRGDMGQTVEKEQRPWMERGRCAGGAGAPSYRFGSR